VQVVFSVIKPPKEPQPTPQNKPTELGPQTGDARRGWRVWWAVENCATSDGRYHTLWVHLKF